ncbi:MAG: hypothetical protein HZA22_02725 [Nitrospirae bacterium]|nr:hypothetical protein [Nitrospirota bacterium]
MTDDNASAPTSQGITVGQSIPQLFYDLIGRIVPGLAVLVTAYLVWKGPVISTVLDSIITPSTANASTAAASAVVFSFASVGVFLVITLLAFTLSHVLNGLWLCCKPPLRKLIDKTSSQMSTKTTKPHADNPHKLQKQKRLVDYVDAEEMSSEVLEAYETAKRRHFKEFPMRALMSDYIRLKDPNAGARIAKIRAEEHMCRVLIVGWSLLFALNLFTIGQYTSISSWLWGESLLLLGIAGVHKIHKHSQNAVLSATIIHWLLLRYGLDEEAKDVQPSSSQTVVHNHRYCTRPENGVNDRTVRCPMADA